MIPAAMYGRRDSRVTFDLPQPFAAMIVFGAQGERGDERRRRGNAMKW
jgi:hypothetical protein